jgi:antirestriction protein ArdC
MKPISQKDYKKLPGNRKRQRGGQEQGKNLEKKSDIYTCVTNKIIADLEQGELTWQKPWNTHHLGGRITKPLRHNGTPYQGINVILLWAASAEHGYTSNLWMTYLQALALGAQVRKGSRGELITYANKITKQEEISDEDGTCQTLEKDVFFMKGYTVFNVEQIEGLPAPYYVKPEPLTPTIGREETLESFFASAKGDIRHGGDRAYYALQPDYVQMPPLEMTHWTCHPSRLDRDFGRKRWGDEGYAREELVAELGSAFLCAELGITPETRPDHAAYIKSWLPMLKNDKRAIFSATADAQRAVNYLLSLQSEQGHRKGGITP